MNNLVTFSVGALRLIVGLQ